MEMTMEMMPASVGLGMSWKPPELKRERGKEKGELTTTRRETVGGTICTGEVMNSIAFFEIGAWRIDLFVGSSVFLPVDPFGASEGHIG